jgi:hypothetical protein
MSRGRSMVGTALFRVLTGGGCLGLAGCPYVFGGPDMSHVGATSDDGPPPPVVAQFELVPSLDRLVLEFAVSEGEAPLLGGFVTLNDGDEVIELAIPDDMEEFVPGGTSRAMFQSWALLDCEKGHEATWTMTVTDSAGATSDPMEIDLEIRGLGGVAETDEYDVGTVRAPWVACLQFDGATQQDLAADQEDLLFEDPVGGPRLVQLGWSGAADIDLSVIDWTPGAHQNLASAFTVGEAWEQVEVYLVPDTPYKIKTLFYGAIGGVDAPYPMIVMVSER